MTETFKIGDKVRLVQECPPGTPLKLGDIARIERKHRTFDDTWLTTWGYWFGPARILPGWPLQALQLVSETVSFAHGSKCDVARCQNTNDYGASPNRPDGKWRCGQCRMFTEVF